MKVISRLVPKSVRDLVIALVASALLVLCALGVLWLGRIQNERRLVRMLSETDHYALLAACRELSRRVTTGELEPGCYAVRHHRDPETSQFPRLILGLDPESVAIYADGSVSVLILQLHESRSVKAYPEGRERDHSGSREYVQLVPGLWYFDSGYARYPEHARHIDALIEEGKKRSTRDEQATSVPD